MWGILYLALGCFVGYKLIRVFFPQLFALDKYKLFAGKIQVLPNWMVLFPAAFISGTLLITWASYIFACLFSFTGKSLLFGNIAAFVIFGVAAVFLYLYDKSDKKSRINPEYRNCQLKISCINVDNWPELLFIAFVLIISSYYIFRSFHVSNGNIYTGFSVYSDFGPHLAMIRSFSLGNNFPTGYPHYAANNIRYHFMFQFLAGNLEYLGLRIDWAFNLPSILSLLSFLMLLYSLGTLVTGRRAVGFITGLLFFFRSSAAFFTFIMGEINIPAAIDKILKGDKFIGFTSHEDWGLWTFKDYINQRHFAFSMAVLIISIIIYLPKLLEMFDKLKSSFEIQRNNATKKKIAKPNNEGKLSVFLFSRDAWLPKDWITPIATGLLLGSIAFWHGSLLISTLLILFIMAIFSTHRFEYALTAGLAIMLSFTQSAFFVRGSGSVVEPQFVFGFLADRHNLTGVLSYYFELLGVLPIVAAAGIILSPRGVRWLSLAFLTPLVFATTVTLVPDIAINHKYVAVSVILLNIFAANFLVAAFKTKRAIPVLCVSVLCCLLTITGIANNITIYNMDKNKVSTSMNHPVKEWIEQNTEPSDVFLTSNYVTHPILLAGRKIFNGYQYFAGSAGYDTVERDRITARIFNNSNIYEIKNLLEENGLDYIAIDNNVRSSNQYKVNEELFAEHFKLVYSYQPENGLKIYKVK